MAFDDLRGFLLVAQHGSFSSAATAMGVSRTTLRRQVDALEASAGVPLLQRHRDGVELTDAGHRLATSGRLLEEQFSAALRAVRDFDKKPQGEVRCLVPVGLPPPLLAAIFGLFRESWPGLSVRTEVHASPLSADLEGFDVLVWFGLNDPGSDWVTQTVLEVPIRLFASQPYLDAHGLPQTSRDLARHEVLAWVPPGEATPRLITTRGARRTVRYRLATSDVDLLHECARLDLGIVWAPDAGLPQRPGFEPFVGVLEKDFRSRTEVRLAVPKALLGVSKVRVFLESIELMRQATRDLAG